MECDIDFLRAGGVEVWRAPVGAVLPWASSLSPEERQRAARFRQEDDRHRFVAARGLTRALLGALLGQSPSDVPLLLSAAGKPRVHGDVSAEASFSLAHAGDFVLVAIASGRQVGVDLEAPRALSAAGSLARRFLHPDEAGWIEAAGTELRGERFRRCWTRKEALVKAWGTGMATHMKRFRVPLEESVESATLQYQDRAWSLWDLPAPAGYFAALAAEGLDCRWAMRDVLAEKR